MSCLVITRIQSRSGAIQAFGVGNVAEPPEGRWWDNFREARDQFHQHGQWPTTTHPTLGEWVRRVERGLTRLQRGQGYGTGALALTPDRCLALRRAKYAPSCGRKPKVPAGAVEQCGATP